MAASCSRNSSSGSTGEPLGGWKQLSDSVFEVSRPSEGYIDLEVVFLHGFCSKSDVDSYYQTWMKADGSENWLDTALTEAFPRARILSVSYDSSLITSSCTGRLDMHLLGESLVQSLVDLAGVGRTCPVVLVGHCLGGMVLKKIVHFAERSANEERSCRSFPRPYETFLKHVKGAFFCSTPNLGSDVPIRSMVNQGGPLLDYLKLLGTESSRMNGEFAKLRSRYRWRTFGVFPANQTETTKLLPYLADTQTDGYIDWESVPQYVSIVEEASARVDMDNVCVIPGVDHFTIARSSGSFKLLLSFLRKISKEEEEYAAQLRRSFGLYTETLDLDHRVDGVIKALQLEKAEPLHLVLVGIDGIGKSTLAKQVVNVLKHQFEYICYVELEGVDRSRKSKQLEGLVAQNLFYSNGRRVEIAEGQQPWFVIRGKKVLMIIDDVDSEDEISELLRLNWCGDGSRLIITSSQKKWNQLIVHEVPPLSKQASRQLLVTYLDNAVLRSIPQKLMLEVVEECDGLPLVLEILGKYLRNIRDVNIWSGAVTRLQTEDSIDGRSEENVLWKKLQVSFRSLAPLEKSIFLDLATFDCFSPRWRQYDLEIFKSAWGAHSDRRVVDVALLNLEERSLLLLEEVNHPNTGIHARQGGTSMFRVRIHKQLRYMGRWISRPEKRNPEECRWIPKFNDLRALLIKCKVASNVSRPKTEVLSIHMERKKRVGAGSDSQFQNSGLPVQWTCLSRLVALRLFRISDMHFTASDELKFPLNLALLHMGNCSRVPQKESWWLPRSRLSSWPLRDENIEELGALSVLIFENCSFVQLPQNFHMLQSLEVLQIHRHGIPMGPLPENFGFLPALKHLVLNVSDKRLPSSLLQLPSLQSLVLSGEHLQAWPSPDPTSVGSYSHLKALRELQLIDLPTLVDLPDTFGGLASLEVLKVENCPVLKKLPEGFGALSKLIHLTVRGCDKLERLCESFSSLSQLRNLSLTYLPELKMLPVTMGDLSSLASVDIFRCDAIRELPGNFASLQSLLYLSIDECHGLESLWQVNNDGHTNQGLQKLKILRVTDCDQFRGLQLHGCRECRYRPDVLLHLKSVEGINMSNNGRYINNGLDDEEEELLESRKQISSLCIRCSKDSEALPVSVGLLSPVKELDSHTSERFAGVLDSASHLPGLKWLESQGYEYLSGATQSLVQRSFATSSRVEDHIKSPPVSGSVGQLLNLRQLTLTDYKLTSSFMRQLGSLEALQLRRCRGIADALETITMWSGMRMLHIRDCQTFSTLPNSLRNLTLLTDLKLKDCQDLVSLPETIGQLSSLEHLSIKRCKKLICFPESVWQLKNLRSLAIQNSRTMSPLSQSFSRVGNLISLNTLELVDCQDLISLPESIGQLTSLYVLRIENCSELTCLPGSLGQLRRLTSLRIESCRSILTLPQSVYHMTWLSDLKVFDHRPFENMMVKSLKEFTRLKELGLSTWKGLICLQEFISSVRPEEFRLPHIFVRCMECADTVIPSIKYYGSMKMLNSIDDSCGCIHVIGILKYLESYLFYRGPLNICLWGPHTEERWRPKYAGENYATVAVACGRMKVEGLPWSLKQLQFTARLD
ncbi:hypothetical protein R1sor_026075 [Riccia sorocarpa]|uniref:Uncharacterized protein n=1 Tax=Riccia sorocarpa TaxID=122646 RepID=A0ABD3GAD8_9MARC